MSRAQVITGVRTLDTIGRTSRLIDRAHDRELRATGVTRTQVVFLRTITRLGTPIRFSALAEELGCSQPNVANVVHRMVARGWLQMVTYENEPWRREVVVTDAGREILAKANEKLEQLTEPLATKLAAPEAAAVADVLDNVGKATAPPPPPGPGEVKPVSDVIVTPQPWLDGYPKVSLKPRKMRYGIDEERWNTLTARERMAQQDAFLYGTTMEDILLQWDDPVEWLRRKAAPRDGPGENS